MLSSTGGVVDSPISLSAVCAASRAQSWASSPSPSSPNTAIAWDKQEWESGHAAHDRWKRGRNMP
jgi:hypothetical protein